MKKKNGMGFGLMLAAGVFLWNPVVGMTDVLPDLIGYLLLLGGLSRIADLNDVLGEAREKFRGAVWIALGELLAQFLVNVFIKNAPVVNDPHGQNLPAWTLLFSFVMFAVECWFLIPAYRSLFLGLGALAERKNAAHLRANRRERSQYERMAGFSVLFVAGKNLLSLLPELTSVTTYESELGNPFFRFDWYSYSDMIRLILLVPALLLTLAWLVCWIRVFAAARRDADFQTAIRADYETHILPDYGLLLGRRVCLAFLLFRFGAAFSAVFLLLQDRDALVQSVWHGVELLPDWAAVGFLAVGAWLTRDLVRIRRAEIGFGVAAFLAGLSEWVWCANYYREYTAMDARYVAAAYERIMVLRVVGSLSAILTAVCLCLMVFRVRAIIRDRLRVDYDGDEVHSAVATERLRAEYRARLVWATILVCLIAAGKIADLILRPWFAWVWWIPMLLTAVLVLVLASLLSDLSEALASRYPPKRDRTDPD